MIELIIGLLSKISHFTCNKHSKSTKREKFCLYMVCHITPWLEYR